MICNSCSSDRILTVSGKCSDLCFVTFGELEHDGYVPDNLGIGGGDYLEFNLCMDCGKVQDKFPILDVNLTE
jgi:hypothetical protein